MLVLRVTALRITFLRSSIVGVTGVGMGTSSCDRMRRILLPSSLCSVSESCISFVPRLRLSRLEFISFLIELSGKYPPLMLMLLSILLNKGGEEGPGEGIEICPLALLELHLFFRDFTRARWKLINFVAAGENSPTPSPPGLKPSEPKGLVKPFPVL